MINHVSIGVTNMTRSRAFYNAALGALGYGLTTEAEDSLGYGTGTTGFWVLRSEVPSGSAAPGIHFCFDAPSRDSVDAFHAAAVAHGGHDNGAPGLRADYGPGYYAAFVVDPDGHRLEAYFGE